MSKKIAVTIELSDDDFQMALLQLKRNSLLPKGIEESFFTDGEHTIVNMSEVDPEQSVQMGMGLMLFKIAELDKDK